MAAVVDEVKKSEAEIINDDGAEDEIEDVEDSAEPGKKKRKRKKKKKAGKILRTFIHSVIPSCPPGWVSFVLMPCVKYTCKYFICGGQPFNSSAFQNSSKFCDYLSLT